MSSRFDLNKMVETLDNLSTCLDIMLCCKDSEGGQQITESYLQLDNLNTSLNDQMDVLKESLTKEKNALKSVSYQITVFHGFILFLLSFQ